MLARLKKYVKIIYALGSAHVKFDEVRRSIRESLFKLFALLTYAYHYLMMLIT